MVSLYLLYNTCKTYIGVFSYGDIFMLICDALGDLVPFAQFKKCEKHPWWSVTFSKVAGFSLQLY